MKRVLKKKRTLAMSGGIALLLSAMSMPIAFEGKTYPYTSFLHHDLGWQESAEVNELVQTTVNAYLHTPQKVQLEDAKVMASPFQLGVRIPMQYMTKQIKTIDNGFVVDMLADHPIEVVPYVDPAEMQRFITRTFKDQYTPVENAQYKIKNGTVTVMPEQAGQAINQELLAKALLKQAVKLESSPLSLIKTFEEPAHTEDDLRQHLEKMQALAKKEITFLHEQKKWNIPLEEHLDWITLSEDNELILSRDTVLSWFYNNVIADVEQNPVNISINREEGTIIFSDTAKRGTQVRVDDLFHEINRVVFSDATEVVIPIEVIEPTLYVSDELREEGITELIGIGFTDYRGSTPTRVHNVKVGLEKFNGTFIKEGENFSFVENLGPVDATTGYKKELVIKQDETKKEYGGGLCQVSSTAFRAALFTGLPIVERYPHSYAVSYYARPLGQGLDATIYPGVKDLVFKNDTPGAIVFQTYTEGTFAYFNVFGTKDGRAVELTEHKKWNFKPAPPEQIVYTTDLEPGKKKVTEQALKGFSTSWKRIISKDGETQEETISSTYKAWPKRTMIGVTEEEKQKQESTAAENATLQPEPWR